MTQKPLSSPDPFSPRNRERRGENLSFKAFFSPFLLREGGWGVRL
jgi:hypothetical protein